MRSYAIHIVEFLVSFLATYALSQTRAETLEKESLPGVKIQRREKPGRSLPDSNKSHPEA